MDTPTLHEDHWRWRDDDGGEEIGATGATWRQSEDVAETLGASDLDANIRLRFSKHVEVAQKSNYTGKIQYNLNGGGWNDVNDASLVARSSLSGNFADEDDTTEHGVTFVGTGSFIATNAQMDEDDGETGKIGAFAAQNYVASEHCFQIRSADVSNGDNIELRLVEDDGTAFTAYPSTHANIDITLDDIQSGAGASSGVATVAAIGVALFSAVAASSGLATVDGVGRATFAGVGASSGLATVAGVGTEILSGVASSSGVATVSGVGASTEVKTGAAASSGLATVAGVGRATFAGVGEKIVAGSVAEASGLATVAGVGRAQAAAVAASSGVATVAGVGDDASVPRVGVISFEDEVLAEAVFFGGALTLAALADEDLEN